jgi:diguanylate cyclase (GGDEF)-like protein
MEVSGIDAPSVEAPRGHFWAAAAVLIPAAALGLTALGGAHGLWAALGLTGVLVVMALVFEGRPGRSGYLIAIAVLLRLAALASESDAAGWAAPTQWAAVLASALLVAACASLLAERVRDRAFDMTVEALLGAAALAIAVWQLALDPAGLVHDGADSLAGFALLRTALGLAAIAVVIRVNLASFAEKAMTRTLLVAVVVVTLGDAGLLTQLLRSTSYLTDLATGIVITGLGLAAAAAFHPLFCWRPSFVHTAPARLNLVRLVGLVAVMLVTPGLIVRKAAIGSTSSLSAMAVVAAVLSLLVVAYLVGLLQEWARIGHHAQHDELTGLPNRRHFHDRLSHALAQVETGTDDDDEGVAVLFLDIDRFKAVNDTLGHAAGNAVLQEVSKRLTELAPPGAIVARLQGDEFAVLLPVDGTNPERAVDFSQDVLKLIAKPMLWSRRDVHVSASIGIACYPVDGSEPETLLRSADRAMYRAKSLGRNNAQVHSEELRSAVEGRFDLESALHGAVGRGEMRLLYQPKVGLRNGQVMGAEALLRWEHPELGTISPVDFIPIAEETGLIVELGEWALSTACKQTKAWQDGGFPELTIAVNLSPRQFQLQRVEDLVARTLRSSGLDPRWLELELTESLALQDIDQVSATLGDIRKMGVQCSIDDFGTGWSGLSYLARFPITCLKIDKAFVQSISEDDNDGHASIVLAIIALAQGLKLKVVAEGVETNTQLYFLLRNGCDEMQGFLFSPPVTAERFEELVMLERVARGPGRLRLGSVDSTSEPAFGLNPLGRAVSAS